MTSGSAASTNGGVRDASRMTSIVRLTLRKAPSEALQYKEKAAARIRTRGEDGLLRETAGWSSWP
jgi:hypothetical protein